MGRLSRRNCHRPRKAGSCKKFIGWVVKQVREHKWSLDACVGRAKREHLFEPSEMVCTRTLYDMAWSGLLPIHILELPQAVKHRAKKRRSREDKKHYGTSISQRPEIAGQRIEEVHWEGDTVVGKRAGMEEWGTKVFFAHPHMSWERPQNERHNGMMRTFVPKGAPIEQFSDEDILSAADELNGLPRRKLGYVTPEELFEAFLDTVYAA